MQIQFFGAVGTTTGSMHLLHVNGSRLLLECGLYQGHRKEAFEKNRNIPFDAASVDACILSHAHIDHSGNLPSLVSNGYAGPIYATPATRDLCNIMLADSAYLQVQDVRYVNKKRIRQGKNPFEPLYTPQDVPATMHAFRPLAYDTPGQVADGVALTFRDAGHILGSAFVVLDITEHGDTRRLMFTGDIGRRDMPILEDPHVVRDVDLLITESTYGDRLHPQRKDVKAELARLCSRIERDESKLIIPAFSVGRTQQILYFLNALCAEGAISKIPVFVDSPLSTKATQVYRAHTECFDEQAMALLESGEDPFWFDCLTYTSSVEESKRLNHMQGPAVIISASGMCEGGRILHHLAHSVEDPRNVILFVGYQAQHTLGRRMVDGVDVVKVFGDEFPLRARVESINALSAHADRREMGEYFEPMGREVDLAFVVHGEPESSSQMADDLRAMGMGRVIQPGEGQPYTV